MAKYNIYAGLGGGFGGANYCTTEEFATLEEAEQYAYQQAVDEYESYEGMHGLRSWEEVKEDYCEEFNVEEEDFHNGDYSAIDEEYQQEVEGWIDYRAVLASEDKDFEEEE